MLDLAAHSQRYTTVWCPATDPVSDLDLTATVEYSLLRFTFSLRILGSIGGLLMGTTSEVHSRQTRRNVVKGAAWSVPLMAVGAPAAHAGISQCQVKGSIQVGPKEFVDVRAVCRSQSQTINPTTINANYGRAYLPRYLEICNCENTNQWYRWQETDDRSSFQIEVDGLHNDQNGPGEGWRPSFQLPKYGDVGGCKRFNLTYRTSETRPYSSSQNSVPSEAQSVNIKFVLEKGPSSTGPWTPVTTINVGGGAVWRTIREWSPWNGWVDPINFGSCSPQSVNAARQAAPAAPEGEAKPTDEAKPTREAAPTQQPAGNGD